MLLLHISDIHFRHPHCNTGMDPDQPYRTRLIQDAGDLRQRFGTVDAILVGGDIAFRGAPEEYSAALEWLKELSVRCGCALERIFVIPGNHDVDPDKERASSKRYRQALNCPSRIPGLATDVERVDPQKAVSRQSLRRCGVPGTC